MKHRLETIQGSFNNDFCMDLEYHLTRTFANSTDKEIKRLWCDGVMMPFYDIELTREKVIKTKKIVTTAWIGFDGQGKYDMIIKLGGNSMEACERNLSLTDCLPGNESMEWIIIDKRKSAIELHLK